MINKFSCSYYEEDNGSECGKRTVGSTGLCHTHLRMLSKAEETEKRSLAKRKAAMEKPRKIYAKPKKVSDKMKGKNAEYNERVKEWKMENPECKAKVATQCNGITQDCHHRKKRGDLLMVEKYWLPVCRACHTWIGQNSDEARKRGLTINHLEPEFVEPHKI